MAEKALQLTLMELGNPSVNKLSWIDRPAEIERRLMAALDACCTKGVAISKANMALALGISAQTLNDWIDGGYNSRDGKARYVDSAKDEAEKESITTVNLSLKKWVLVSQSMMEADAQLSRNPGGPIFLLKTIHHLLEVEQEKQVVSLNLDSLLAKVDQFTKAHKND